MRVMWLAKAVGCSVFRNWNRRLVVIVWIIAAIIWIAIAFWPARVADRKGHSFFGYFIFSLVFFPLALIMAYMVQDRTAPGVA